MKNYYTLFITLLLLACCGTAFSQVSTGIRVGMSFGSLSLQDQVLENESMTTPAISLPVEIRLSPLAVVQPELNFVRKSGSLTRRLSSLSSAGASAQSEQKCIYEVDFLQVPVLMKIAPDSKKVGVNVFWGPSMGIALRGSEKSTLVSTYDGETYRDTQERDLVIGDASSEIQKVQWSFVVGGGLNYNLGHSHLVLDVRHQVVLGHVTTVTNEGKIAHQGTTVAVGYMIDLGK